MKLARLLGRPTPTFLATTRLQQARTLTTAGEPTEEIDEKANRRQVISSIEGTPLSILSRKVKIYVPAPSSTQSGVNTATQWEVEFENPDQRQLWGNPLMGWTATDDAISNLRLKFPSKESAIAYCKARGKNSPLCCEDLPMMSEWMDGFLTLHFFFAMTHLRNRAIFFSILLCLLACATKSWTTRSMSTAPTPANRLHRARATPTTSSTRWCTRWGWTSMTFDNKNEARNDVLE